MSTKILIIDDYQDGADVLGQLLQLQGYNVMTAYNGPDGIAAALKDNPNVALVDIGMPGMDGYEVARSLRKTFADQLYIVAVTAWSDRETKQRCTENGFDLHMTKPVNFQALFDVIAAH
jgi:CheY-like chemotaxis protein